MLQVTSKMNGIVMNIDFAGRAEGDVANNLALTDNGKSFRTARVANAKQRVTRMHLDSPIPMGEAEMRDQIRREERAKLMAEMNMTEPDRLPPMGDDAPQQTPSPLPRMPSPEEIANGVRLPGAEDGVASDLQLNAQILAEASGADESGDQAESELEAAAESAPEAQPVRRVVKRA